VRAPAAPPSLGRPAAACPPRPPPNRPAAPPPPRRTAPPARRAPPLADAPGAGPPAPRRGYHHALRHPRPGGGTVAVHPRRRTLERRPRAGGPSRGDLLEAAQRLRGGVRGSGQPRPGAGGRAPRDGPGGGDPRPAP